VPLPQYEYPAGVSRNAIPVNVIHHYHTDRSQGRRVRVPNADQPDLAIYVGSPDGYAYGPEDTYEVILEGDPLPGNDTVLFVDGALKIRFPDDGLLRIEGSLIVDGSFSLSSGAELLAWENRTSPWFVPLGESLYDMANTLEDVGPADGFYHVPAEGEVVEDTLPSKDIRYSHYPALAANGKITVSGGPGPAHIEGVVYTVGESHLHRSDFEEAAYSVGSEIADTIHNCQFFSFAYDPEARNTLGFDNRVTGRTKLAIVRLTE
jgi:hypothetical protein